MTKSRFLSCFVFFAEKQFPFFSAANHSRPEPSPTNIKKKCKHFLRKEDLAKNRHWTIVIRSDISKIDTYVSKMMCLIEQCFPNDQFFVWYQHSQGWDGSTKVAQVLVRDALLGCLKRAKDYHQGRYDTTIFGLALNSWMDWLDHLTQYGWSLHVWI